MRAMASSSDQPLCKRFRKTENEAQRFRKTEKEANAEMKQKVVGCLNMRGVSTKLLQEITGKLTEQNLSRRFLKQATKDRFAEVRRDIVLPLAAGGASLGSCRPASSISVHSPGIAFLFSKPTFTRLSVDAF